MSHHRLLNVTEYQSGSLEATTVRGCYGSLYLLRLVWRGAIKLERQWKT